MWIQYALTKWGRGNEMQNGSGLSIAQMVAFMECAPANVFFKDTSCRYRAVSEVCSLINGGAGCDIIGKTDMEVWRDKEVGARYYEDDLRIIATGEGSKWVDEFAGPNGSLYFEISKKPAYLDGELIGIVGIVTDITEQKRLEAELKRLTQTDQLTGLFNRNYLEMRVQNTSFNALLPMSIIVLDCNHLKETNDTLGHKAGDELIVRVAEVIKNVAPPDAVAARIGGDEFLVTCGNMDEQRVQKLMLELRVGFKQSSNEMFDLDVAMGCATAKTGKESFLSVFKEADARMYADKHASRAR